MLQRSLRFKLVFASVVVELVMLTFLVANSLRLMHDNLIDQAELRLKEVRHLLAAALAAPLVQRDLATLQDILDTSRRDEGIVYLVLDDERERPLVASGWDLAQPTPPASTRLDVGVLGDSVTRADIILPISMAGIAYGSLHFGVSMEFLRAARVKMLSESLTIAALEILLSVAILAALGVFLTRNLKELTKASARLAQGEIDVVVPSKTKDEVGQLADSFNAMARAIRSRIDELKGSEERFHAIADYTYDWESWYGVDGRLIWVNPSVLRLTGYTVAECLSMPDFPFSIVHHEDMDVARRDYTIRNAGDTGTAQFRVVRKDGSSFWARAGWQPIYDARGVYQGIRSGVQDISEQKVAEISLREKVTALRVSEERQRQLATTADEEQARMKALLGALQRGILFETPSKSVVYLNNAFKEIWAIQDAPELIVGKNTTEVIQSRGVQLAEPNEASRVCDTALVGEEIDLLFGDERVITQVGYPVYGPNRESLGQIWIFEDVTRERQTAKQLVYLAERDPLTGLYNRRRFQQELGRALYGTARRGTTGALMLFDLDEFKHINDTFGHQAGDSILLRVAGEISGLIRHTEQFARLGGDEFGVLMPEATPAEVQRLAERIIRSVAQIPFRIDGRAIQLTTSIGIAMYPEHGTEHDELVARADAAMYQAKAAGKNGWRIYRPDLDTSREMIERMSWNRRLEEALNLGNFRLHFQGIYDAHSGELTHMEALVRMLDANANYEEVAPGRFIVFAEKTGRIVDIDRWVIRRAAKTLAQADYPRGVPLSVNISGRSLDDPLLPEFIMSQLRTYGVPAHQFMVEVTETAAISDLEDAQRFVDRLRQFGCKVCLDDFGAGFCSFTYIKHLAVDIIKIDGQFIVNLPHDRDNQVFVKAMVDVARGVGKKTVAEFVQDAATLALLKEIGVDMLQGYYLNIPAAEFPRRLA